MAERATPSADKSAETEKGDSNRTQARDQRGINGITTPTDNTTHAATQRPCGNYAALIRRRGFAQDAAPRQGKPFVCREEGNDGFAHAGNRSTQRPPKKKGLALTRYAVDFRPSERRGSLGKVSTVHTDLNAQDAIEGQRSNLNR